MESYKSFYVLTFTNEKVWVICEKSLAEFLSNLCILRLPASEKKEFLRNFSIPYRNQKCEDEFVNQPNPTKIVKIRAFFVFKIFF